MDFQSAEDIHYPGLAMLSACLTPFRRGFGAAGVDASSSVAIFGFFARLTDDGFGADGVFSGLGSRSVGALRLRDLG
jgi:hypothetical protein